MSIHDHDPIYEREVVTGTHVIRATLALTSDGEPYATTQTETDTGPLTYVCAPLTRDQVLEVIDIHEGLLRAMDRATEREAEAA